MGLLLLEGPDAPLVSLDEARIHLKDPAVEDNDLVLALLAAATAQAEAYTRRRFLPQRWRVTLDAFPCGALVLPFPPLLSVESVKYLDAAGTLQTVAAEDYAVRTAETPGEIVPAYGKFWPAARATEDAVRVEFTCGYVVKEDEEAEAWTPAVPEGIRRAVLLVVGTLYANRESVITGTTATPLPQSAEWLLSSYRVVRV